MSALQTSASKVRLTNWIPPVGCLEEEGILGARGESWSLPVASTSYMTLKHFFFLFFFPPALTHHHWDTKKNPGEGIPREKKEKICPNK